MGGMHYEIILHWATVTLYAVSGILFAAGIFFRKDGLLRAAYVLAVCGFLFHTAALGIRWVAAGRAPFMRRYEVYSSNVWVGMAFYVIAARKSHIIRPAGVFVMPVAFLLIGMAVMASPEIRELPPIFRNPWLPLHVAFAKLAFAGCLIGSGLAVLYLLSVKRGGPLNERLPEPEIMDQLSYQFIAFGFVSLGIMIVSGAIWAESAWGRYWGWDPVETWSLVAWAVYGIYLHLRRIHRWQGVRAAWLALFAMLVLMFVLFWLGVVFPGNHSPYSV